ncbi:ABC transporter substrate-binding protein [Allokutzneria sp. NRRL B-24872]|uniref:ABC transporter substrate-binding protein n=1 Tax=Allokutzneria sp. NRRL B-24872 TaxID=1137961 RepID=UPI000A3A1773|nr:ABC transporter substrate-binding protein [Allokutzneria sp. NRRL B-24872]
MPTVGRARTPLFALVAVTAALAGCGQASAPQAGGAAEIRVAYVPVATYLPALVAEDAGIFARNRLEVTLTPTQNLSATPGTLGRQFDIASATPTDLIKAVGQGIGIAAVATSSVETPEVATAQVVVAKESPIRSVRDLAGKRVGAPTIGAAFHNSLLNWISEEGGDPASITGVEMPFSTMPDQLKAGRVDAVEAIQPVLGTMLAQGARSIGSPFLSVGESPVLVTLWTAQRAWAESNAGTVQRWRRSLAEAEQLIKDDPKTARAILRKYTQLSAELADTVQLPVYGGGMAAAELRTRLEPWQEALRRSGQFNGTVPADKLVTQAGS